MSLFYLIDAIEAVFLGGEAVWWREAPGFCFAFWGNLLAVLHNIFLTVSLETLGMLLGPQEFQNE